MGVIVKDVFGFGFLLMIDGSIFLKQVVEIFGGFSFQQKCFFVFFRGDGIFWFYGKYLIIVKFCNFSWDFVY